VVAKVRGAITYIPPTELDPTVRAITVDGHSYRDVDYPLRAAH
jgi:hypothetical protein